METKNLAELYDLAPLDWKPIDERLTEGFTQAPGTGGPNRHTFWLATINADGTPHLTGIGGEWRDGAIWFVTGQHSRKARNIARDPRCTFSLTATEFDVVLEGTAELITESDAVGAVAWRAAEGGWPAKVDESGTAITAQFSAPSAGPPPWSVYKMTPHRATALQTIDPGGASTWTF